MLVADFRILTPEGFEWRYSDSLMGWEIGRLLDPEDPWSRKYLRPYGDWWAPLRFITDEALRDAGEAVVRHVLVKIVFAASNESKLESLYRLGLGLADSQSP